MIVKIKIIKIIFKQRIVNIVDIDCCFFSSFSSYFFIYFSKDVIISYIYILYFLFQCVQLQFVCWCINKNIQTCMLFCYIFCFIFSQRDVEIKAWICNQCPSKNKIAFIYFENINVLVYIHINTNSIKMIWGKNM